MLELKKIQFWKKDLLCQAPANTLRFNHSGKVIACCYNRGYILGSFPEQSIQEIWFGTKAKKLRKAIAKGDFNLGCHSCEKDIKCGNQEASGAYQYNYLKDFKKYKDFPTMLDLELGSTCNFECVMCSGEYSSAIRVNREKQKAYYSPYEEHTELFIEQLIPFLPHLKEIRFIGGEPFMMKVYYRIWDEVIRINPAIVLNVLTNASILNKRVMDILNKGNFKISVSIDSLVKDTYESIRKNGDFDVVMKNIDFIQKRMAEKNYVMNFNLCVMRQNWNEIPDYFQYCNQNNIKIVLHTVKFPAHCAIWNLPKEKLKEIIACYEHYEITEKTSIEAENKITYHSLLQQVRNWESQAPETEEIAGNLLEIKSKLQGKIEAVNHTTKISNVEAIFGIINQFEEKDQIKIIDFLLKIEIQLVLDELNISSKERLMERFKTIARE